MDETVIGIPIPKRTPREARELVYQLVASAVGIRRNTLRPDMILGAAIDSLANDLAMTFGIMIRIHHMMTIDDLIKQCEERGAI